MDIGLAKCWPCTHFLAQGGQTFGKCPMFETSAKIDHDAIMREARDMRAKAMLELMQAVVSFFRRKPVGSAAKA
ncbi:MAG: RSP_7527 family protein [Paracoccaceae bacterium]